MSNEQKLCADLVYCKSSLSFQVSYISTKENVSSTDTGSGLSRTLNGSYQGEDIIFVQLEA